MKHNLFDSYIWKSKIKYDNKNYLIQNLTNNFIKNKNKLTPGWQCFVYSSFKDEQYNNIPEDLLDIIEEKIKEYLNDCPKKLGISGIYKIKDVWYNVYEKNYSQEPHDHGDSFISGCYYIKFNKYLHHQTTFYNPNFNLDYSKLEYNSYFCRELDCEEDDIIIFPSNIKHGTKGLKEKNSDELRITISFNVTIDEFRLTKKSTNQVFYN